MSRRGWRGVTGLGRAALAVLLLALPLGACSNDEAGGATLAVRVDDVPREPPVIPAPSTPYEPRVVLDGGSVTGTVRVGPNVPQDTTVAPTMDRQVCGTSFADRTIERSNDRLAGALVWITDVRSGRPLPLRKRFDIRYERCRLEPRVQGVVTGGTLNVRSADAITHRTRVLRQGTGEVVTGYLHNDHGQVVPDDRLLSRPGLLEFRSDVHPWTRAFVAVFDHPYFAVTDRNGAFTLENVPAGTYRIAAWHERLGRTEGTVTVRAGAASTITLGLGDAVVVADTTRSHLADSDTAAPPAGGNGSADAAAPR